ncbi:hypothetical protein ES703_97643 [subsurface metagenome]
MDQGTTYRADLNSSRDAVLRFELDNGNNLVTRTIRLKGRKKDKPSILMISNRGRAISYLENRYNLEKVSPAQALAKNLYDYPLLIFDGLSIRSIGPELSSILTHLYQKRLASLFFISDSPDFGTRGDNLAVEEILPAQLTPRSLKYLPDLGILILLDISSSMMGEKLSLAKLSTLELIKNLKDSDQVSLLTFWDGFEEKKNIQAEIDLVPLIARGGTDLHKALKDGLGRLIKFDMPQKHIIILSDGNTEKRDFNELIKLAVMEKISITTLAVGEDINSELLNRLAKKAGGHYYRVQTLEEIPSLIFEDRRDISRSAFGEDSFSIFDYTDDSITRISGMSIFAPKRDRFIFYRNQYEDPLLLMEKRDKQLILMFLSDIYGYYTGDFFSKKSVQNTFNTIFHSILVQESVNFRIGETCGTMAFTLAGERLLRPSLAVYADNRLIVETQLTPGSFNSYNAVIQIPDRGEYTAILSDRGSPISRIPFYFNGSLEGRDTGSFFEYKRFHSTAFKALQSPFFFLYLFFICSVYITYRSRRKR